MTSGKCGDNLTWTLDDGTLTISGRGKMYDYFVPFDVPWASSRELIRNVIFTEGVTMIGSRAFSGCTSLTSVIIPDSVTTIGDWFFYYCTSLEKIYYKRDTKINLKSLQVGNNVKFIPYDDLPPVQVKPPEKKKLEPCRRKHCRNQTRRRTRSNEYSHDD